MHILKRLYYRLFKHIIIMPNVKIGKNVDIGYGSIIGSLSMVTDVVGKERVWRDNYSITENKEIIIGDNVKIGNYSLVNFGWKEPTIIKNNVWIGNYTSIGHDCIVNDNVAIVSGVILGGHCEIGEWTFVAPMVYISPFVKIGKHCYIGPYSNVTKDVPDGSFGYGNPYRVKRENEWRP